MPAAMVISTNTVPDSIRFLRWGFYTTSWGDGVVIAAPPESRRRIPAHMDSALGPARGGLRVVACSREKRLEFQSCGVPRPLAGKIFPPSFRS